MTFKIDPMIYVREIDPTYVPHPHKISVYSYEEACMALANYPYIYIVVCVAVPRAAYVTNCFQAKQFFEGVLN